MTFFQSYQTKFEALFPSKWVIKASCSYIFKTMYITTPIRNRPFPTPTPINWNWLYCKVQKEVFIRFSLGTDIKVGHTNQFITGFDILNQIWAHIYSHQWSQLKTWSTLDKILFCSNAWLWTLILSGI